MNDESVTPGWLFTILDNYYQFDMDMAANEGNSKCGFYTSDAARDKGVVAKFSKSIWCHPPNSRGNLDRFVDIFIFLGETVPRVVALLPVDTSTGWFKKMRTSAKGICFINRRLSFGNGEENEMRSHMIVVFGTSFLESAEIDMLAVWGEVWDMEFRRCES